MRLITVLVFFSLIISCKPEKSSLVEQYSLSSNWIFRDKNEAEYYPANVPGTVHTDLQGNGVIPNPFYGCNEQKLQWIGERSWIYKTQFYVDSAILSKKNTSIRKSVF